MLYFTITNYYTCVRLGMHTVAPARLTLRLTHSEARIRIQTIPLSQWLTYHFAHCGTAMQSVMNPTGVAASRLCNQWLWQALCSVQCRTGRAIRVMAIADTYYDIGRCSAISDFERQSTFKDLIPVGTLLCMLLQWQVYCGMPFALAHADSCPGRHVARTLWHRQI